MKTYSSSGINSTEILGLNNLIAWCYDFKGTNYKDLQKVIFRHVSDEQLEPH